MLERLMGERDRRGQDGVVGWLGSQRNRDFYKKGERMGTRIPALPPGFDDLRLKRKKAKLSWTAEEATSLVTCRFN